MWGDVFVPLAKFDIELGAQTQMFVSEDRFKALMPQSLGLVIPFEDYLTALDESHPISWGLSYLYAELWVNRRLGSQFIAPALPEFFTETHRPTELRIPLTHENVAVLEEVRAGSDLVFTLHLQATITGSAPVDRVPDDGRRRTLQTWGIPKEVIGPVRSSDNVVIRVPKLDWVEEILPQWRSADQNDSPDGAPVTPEVRTVGQRLDAHALARTLSSATPTGDVEEILEHVRAPIVGF